MTKAEGMKEKLKGLFIVMITPFKNNYELDEEGLRKNTRFFLEKGISNGNGGLIPGGSTGECFNLTIEERKKVLDIVIDEAKGEAPVIFGCNHTNTKSVIELAQHAERAGADGILVMPPYYGVPSEEMIIQFYKDIADNTNLGIMAYNNPEVVGVDMSNETMLKIINQVKSLVAYKDVSNDLGKLDLSTYHLSDKISVGNGTGDAFEPYGTLMGRHWNICAIANAIPELYLEIYNQSKNENYKKAKVLHDKLYPILDVTWNGGEFVSQPCFISFIKAAVNTRNNVLAGGPARLPILPVTDVWKARIEKMVKDILKEI
ncbi:MAG: dihydrodipicolinate synthase family protein [Candidatus Humimicrobiaceae bacterium]